MNAKGDLIARLVTLGAGTPTFEAEARGPAHERTFRVRIWSAGRVIGEGEGRSKKDAERVAAEAALRGLGAEEGRTPEPAPVFPAANDADPTETGNAEPWPIYAAVLAQAIEAAVEFAPEDAGLGDVQRSAAHFYQGLLSDLGHGPGLSE